MGNGSIVKLSIEKPNKRTKRQNFRKILCNLCQSPSSNQLFSQNDCNYNPFLSLYKISWKCGRNELTIYDTEKEQEKVKILDTKLSMSESSSITQLPNGYLFVLSYGGAAFMIDRSYRVRTLPWGVDCTHSFAIYFDNNIYCFGGRHFSIGRMAISTKFDINKNRWINLTKLPSPDFSCHSVVFNRNILISGFASKNLWLYSIEIDSFSAIPYDFSINARKVLVNAEKLYLIQWNVDGLVYESEDVHNWKQISKLHLSLFEEQIYCIYNKEKIYISMYRDTKVRYFQFDLKNKDLLEFKVIHAI